MRVRVMQWTGSKAEGTDLGWPSLPIQIRERGESEHRCTNVNRLEEEGYPAAGAQQGR